MFGYLRSPAASIDEARVSRLRGILRYVKMPLVRHAPFSAEVNLTLPVKDKRAITIGMVFNRAGDGHVEEAFLQIGAAVTSGKGGISVMHTPGRVVGGGYVELAGSWKGVGVARGYKPGHDYWQAGPALSFSKDPLEPSGTFSAFFLVPVPK